MGIKADVVRQVIDITGNIIADQLSKPDWEARKANIEQYYKDLEPIKKDLPDAPVAREIPEQRGENGKVDEIVNQICSGLSPKELLECKSCVESVIRDPSVMNKYLKPSATG